MSARVLCSLLLAISCKLTIQASPLPKLCRVVWFESQAMPTDDLSAVRVFHLNAKCWPDDDSCPQWAAFEDKKQGEFCPANTKAYTRGMWLSGLGPAYHDQHKDDWKIDMPVEFVISCDYALCLNNETCQRTTKMRDFGNTAKEFAVNVVEGSSGQHACHDMFGHKRIRPHGLVDACEFDVKTSANSISGAVQRLWTSSNYQDLTEQYDQEYLYDRSKPVRDFDGHWQSLVDTNQRTDECTLNYGYRMLTLSVSPWNSISIEYNAHCGCVKDPKKCEPLQEDPLLGICPRGATIHIPVLGPLYAFLPNTQTKFRSKRSISIFGEQPFSKECHAYMLFGTSLARGEVQIELGEHCPSASLRDDDHGCHQYFPGCYGVRAKHMAVACCSWRYCNDPEDPHDADCYNKTAEDGQSASGLLGTINAYLFDPDKPTKLPQTLTNKIGYCAYHSNIPHSIEQYHEGPPEHCYTFVDLKWRRFVGISIGWNFDLSSAELLDFPPDKNCTLIHGTARKYCHSITECTDGLDFKAIVGSCPSLNDTEMAHTVVACRCEADHSDPWKFCDEHVTVASSLNSTDMPKCFEGVLPYSENGTYDKNQTSLSSAWNVLCYVHTFTNNITGLKYRKYGFYDPANEHFEEHRWMNCFPLNCTEDEDFCCCRTSKVPGEVCNDPEADLWAQFRVIRDALRVKSERRDPKGISLNDEEFEKCEGKKPWMHAPPIVSPQDLVTGFVGHDMCYFRQLPHELAQTDEDPENHTVRAFYKPPMPAPDPLAAIVCDRERWTVREWLDGCSCQLSRRPEDGIWEQYCCCIATKTETITKAIWHIRYRHQLRTLGDFLYE